MMMMMVNIAGGNMRPPLHSVIATIKQWLSYCNVMYYNVYNVRFI